MRVGDTIEITIGVPKEGEDAFVSHIHKLVVYKEELSSSYGREFYARKTDGDDATMYLSFSENMVKV